MIGSPWWQRVWTLQEQCLARQCMALQGRKSISLSSLQPNKSLDSTVDYLSGGSSFYNYFVRNFVRNFVSESRKIADPSQRASRDALRFGEDNEFVAARLLEIAFILKAKHPIDKIYGLHSLLTTYCNLPLSAPDYRKTAEDVYEETVWVWINTRGDLSILKLAARPYVVHNLPSWVPAWHQQHPRSIRNIGSSDSPERSVRTFAENHFDWAYPSQHLLLSGISPDLPREIENPIPVASVSSPGKLRVLHARFAGRVSHALGPDRSHTWRQYHESTECGRMHLEWCRLILDVFSHNTTKCAEALHEMFRSLWLPGAYQRGPRHNEGPQFQAESESFRAWFDFLRYLTEASDLSASVPAQDADASHGRRCAENLYFDVCVAEQEDEATNILERDYRGDVQGREGLTKLARHIRSIHDGLALMRNHSLCILDNDNMIAITDYWCQEGDEIFVFPGTYSPFVLRKAPGGDDYRLIGPASVHRIWMVGCQNWRSEGDDLQDIVLI